MQKLSILRSVHNKKNKEQTTRVLSKEQRKQEKKSTHPHDHPLELAEEVKGKERVQNQPVTGVLSPTGQKTFGQSGQLTTEAHKNIISKQRTDQGLSVHEIQGLDDSSHLKLSQLQFPGTTETTNNTSTSTNISTDSSKEKSTFSIISATQLEAGHYQQKDTGNQIYEAKDNLQEQLQQNKGHYLYLCSGTGSSANNESIQLNSNDTTGIENSDVRTLIKNSTLHATCEPPATIGSENIPHLYSEGNTTATCHTPSESNNDHLVYGRLLQPHHGMDTQNNTAMGLNQPQQPPTISDLLMFMKQSQKKVTEDQAKT